MKITAKKMDSSAFVPTAVFFLTVLLGMSVSEARAQMGSIAGKVVAGDTGAPLAGASVVVTGNALERKTGALSAEDGSFRVGQLPVGVYTVEVSFIGYVREIVRQVEVVDGETAVLEVEMEPAPYELTETVVSASRRRENIIDAPVSISKIGREEAQRNAAAHSYSSLLRDVKGVDYTQTGMFAEAFNTRGFNTSFNTRMLTLLDGIPFSPPAALTTTLPVARDDIQDVEVIVGPGSALYGPNAVAGIVNVTSREPRESQGTSLGVSAGSRNVLKGRLRHAGVHDRWGWKVAGDYQQANDFEVVNTFYNADSTNWVTDEPDFDAENMRGGIGLFYYSNAETRSGFRVGGSRTTIIDMLDTGRAQRKDAEGTYQQFMYSSPRLHVNVHRSHIDNGDSYTLHGYARNRLAGMAPEEAKKASGLVGTSTFLGAEARYKFGIPALRNARFNVGADARGEDHESPILEGGKLGLRQIGFYGHTEVDLDSRFRLVLAARGDFHESYDTQFSPKAALIYKLRPTMALRFTFNRAYRSPSYVQQRIVLPLGPDFFIRGSGDGFRFGTESGDPLPSEYAHGIPSIQPEENTTFEVGFKGVLANSVFLDVSAYTSKYRDFISSLRPIGDRANGIVVLDEEGNLRTGELTYTYMNFGERTVRGLDVGVNCYISNQVLLKGNASLIEADALKAPEGFTQAFNTPGTIFNAALSTSDLLSRGTSMDLAVRHVVEYDFSAGVHVGRVPAYTVVDLNLGYQMWNGVTYRLTVKNLLDNEHIEFLDAARIGRLAVGELQYAF